MTQTVLYVGNKTTANDSLDSQAFGLIDKTFDEAAENNLPEVISAAGDMFEMLNDIYNMLKYYPELHKPFVEFTNIISFTTQP